MKKNKLTDLNNYLFEQLERINNDDLNPEELDTALKKAEAVTKIAETVIKNGELQFKAANLAADYGLIERGNLPMLFTTKNTEGNNEEV